jgi:hypothetical protein
MTDRAILWSGWLVFVVLPMAGAVVLLGPSLLLIPLLFVFLIVGEHAFRYWGKLWTRDARFRHK